MANMVALAICVGLSLAASRAGAETLREQAELWGALHGAATYCGRRDSDAFGSAAMRYFKRRAASSAEFNRLRDIYGLTVIHTARVRPGYAAGGSCSGFSEKYRAAWAVLRR